MERVRLGETHWSPIILHVLCFACNVSSICDCFIRYSSPVCDTWRSWEWRNWHPSPAIGFFLSVQWWVSWDSPLPGCSKCDPWTEAGTLQTFVRNTNSQVPLKTSWSQILMLFFWVFLGGVVVVLGFLFVWLVGLVFETGFLSVALAVLDLTL